MLFVGSSSVFTGKLERNKEEGEFEKTMDDTKEIVMKCKPQCEVKTAVTLEVFNKVYADFIKDLEPQIYSALREGQMLAQQYRGRFTSQELNQIIVGSVTRVITEMKTRAYVKHGIDEAEMQAFIKKNRSEPDVEKLVKKLGDVSAGKMDVQFPDDFDQEKVLNILKQKKELRTEVETKHKKRLEDQGLTPRSTGYSVKLQNAVLDELQEREMILFFNEGLLPSDHHPTVILNEAIKKWQSDIGFMTKCQVYLQ